MHAGNRIRTLALIGLVAVALMVFGGLTFKVNAVKSELRTAENRIIALSTRQMMLETELETRASQRQLTDWNAVDFGYRPPRSAQFLESERQLAALGAPRAPGAPVPIRAASYLEGGSAEAFAMTSGQDGVSVPDQTFTKEAVDQAEEKDNVAPRLAGYLGSAGRIALSVRTGVPE